MVLGKLVAFTATVSLSGMAYIKYIQYSNFNKKVEEMKKANTLESYLFNAAQQSSYFVDQMMNNFEKGFNISHVSRYKSTLLKFVEGNTLQVCGGSNRNLRYYPPGTKLTLIDWSPNMVAIGGSKPSPTVNYNYVVGDVTKMPFKDNQFDTVVDIFGLEHVIFPQKALYEMRRVCKKDGHILLMNHGLSEVLQFHYWQNAISASNLCKMGTFTNRNWQKIIKQFDFQVEMSERKKNGKLYIYVLKNKKDKDLSAGQVQAVSE